MTLFSAWFLIGFTLGAFAGTLATDLTREDVLLKSEPFVYNVRLWQWSRQQGLAFVVLVWLALLSVTIIPAFWPESSGLKLFLPGELWKNLLLGTVIGAAAAPWVWLHFVREFGSAGILEQAKLDRLIIARAHQIWLEQGQPSDHAQEHYEIARKEFEDVKQEMVEASAKSAEQQLARYRLVSILLGAALLVAMLLPVLHDWLSRTQQFQAFGISLTLIAQRADSARGSPVVGYNSRTDTGDSGDHLLDAMTEAYQIGAANLREPIAILESVGSDLKNFGNLSMIDRDRAFIAWLTYELPGNGFKRPLKRTTEPSKRTTEPSLSGYVEQAEDLLQKKYHPAKWVDPSLDIAFAAGSTIISSCLYDYAAEVHDPHFFAVDVGRFLRSFVFEVHAGPSLMQSGYPFDYSAYLGSSSELPKEGVGCDFDSIRLLKPDIEFPPQINKHFNISPYPSLIAADYLAAIGAVDTGVLFIEEWIKDFNTVHKGFLPEYEPQLGWYLLRAQLSAINLPYQFGGFVVPHRQLVSWQSDESEQFARLLRIGDADGWKQVCDKMLSPSIHNNIGQWLALNYVMDRFYLFENLTSDDFNPSDSVIGGSLTNYLREAVAIRDHHPCIERVPSFAKARNEYTSYFNLYTAHLHLITLASEHDATSRKSLEETISQELGEADHFGTAKKPSSLLASGDVWERHRTRLKLLHEQLENETQRDRQS